MGHYNNATICLNGHVVSKYQANYQKFCSKCGKETYSLEDYSINSIVLLEITGNLLSTLLLKNKMKNFVKSLSVI